MWERVWLSGDKETNVICPDFIERLIFDKIKSKFSFCCTQNFVHRHFLASRLVLKGRSQVIVSE